MQKLIPVLNEEIHLDVSNDQYIIDTIQQSVLNSKIDKLFLQANNCIDDENFSESLIFYDLILQEDPNNIRALIDKGTTLQILGEIDLAISYFDKSLNISPDNIDALINKGSALHLNGKYLDAIACYDRSLTIDKKCSMALAYKGLSLGELGNLVEAINYFKKALSFDKHCTLAQISQETAQSLLDLKSKKL